MYKVPIGRGVIRREGKDVTIVAISYMAYLAEAASQILQERGVSVELIDLRSIKPWDKELVLASVRKTGRLLIADGGWRTCGVAAEIAATVAEEAFRFLKTPIVRITLPDAPAPVSASLERAYYPTADSIVAAAEQLLKA